ncbi:hypothetical protein BDZ89DRAFT_1152279 [Hymenopellis radicata]|nr:hypothetical protein BDZ89DRAFT_1152279 [Hymenopellis radicata]
MDRRHMDALGPMDDPDVAGPGGMGATDDASEGSGSGRSSPITGQVPRAEPDDDEGREALSQIDEIRISQLFIKAVQEATLEEGKLEEDTLDRLRNPIEEEVDISDRFIRLSLDIYLDTTNASVETYNDVRNSVLRCYPDAQFLSHHDVTKLVESITGIVTVADDMCINSCMSYVGPWADDPLCYYCAEPRYDQQKLLASGQRVPRRQVSTTVLGPQLQVTRRSKEGSAAMQYVDRKMAEVQQRISALPDGNDGEMVYDDIMCGTDFRALAERLKLSGKDSLVSLSWDGLRLYQNKKSDCWIAAWIVNNLAPGGDGHDGRYKKKRILPNVVVPGPNKPKNTYSFLFRGLHHLSALQREDNGRGIRIWDAQSKEVFSSRTILLFGLADAVGLPEVDGRVGHHGARGCRLGCPMKGRHKAGTGHYHPVHLQPENYDVAACNHGDVDIRSLKTQSPEEYHEQLKRVLNARPDQYDTISEGYRHLEAINLSRSQTRLHVFCAEMLLIRSHASVGAEFG